MRVLAHVSFLQLLRIVVKQNGWFRYQVRRRDHYKEIVMKKIFAFTNLAAFLAILLAVGTTDADAQRRRPVLKKRPVVRKVVTRPAMPMYTVAAGQIIRAKMNQTLSSKTAVEGNSFTARVTEPIYSSTGVIVIPEGSTLTGRVDSVTRARKGGNPGAIDVSFTSVRLPNGRVRAINGSLTDLESKTAKSDNEGTASGDRMKNRKIIFIGGGGAGGAVLGAAVGGGKGALIGGLIGAGAGLLGERMTKGEEATVKSGQEFGVYLNQSISMPKFAEATP